MHLFLYVAAAWIAVDVLVVMAWHRAHVVVRRGSVGVASSTPLGLSSNPEARRRAGHLSPTSPARPGYFQLLDA